MSSLEIAKLTGKRHDNVVRDIESMFKELEIGESKFGSTYLDKANQQRKCYNLDESLAFELVIGYGVRKRRLIKMDRQLIYSRLTTVFSGGVTS